MCSGDKRGKQGRHEQCLCVRCVQATKWINKERCGQCLCVRCVQAIKADKQERCGQCLGSRCDHDVFMR